MTTEVITFKHIVPIQIRFNDCDIMSHVNNAIHFEYCDCARLHYFQNILNLDLYDKEKSLVIAHIDVDFISPIKLYDRIAIKTKIHKIGTKSLTMLQHIVDTETDTVKSIVKTILVCINHNLNQTILVPFEWKHKIEHYENL